MIRDEDPKPGDVSGQEDAAAPGVPPADDFSDGEAAGGLVPRLFIDCFPGTTEIDCGTLEIGPGNLSVCSGALTMYCGGCVFDLSGSNLELGAEFPVLAGCGELAAGG